MFTFIFTDDIGIIPSVAKSVPQLEGLFSFTDDEVDVLAEAAVKVELLAEKKSWKTYVHLDVCSILLRY